MSSDPGAIPLVRPPTLRHDETRGATRLELFFDLAYVLAVAALAANLVTDVDWGGVGEFASLLVLIWLSWVQFTLYNNRFDTDDLVLRLGKFAAMAAVLGCAASMSEATGSLSTPFAVSYLAGRTVLLSCMRGRGVTSTRLGQPSGSTLPPRPWSSSSGRSPSRRRLRCASCCGGSGRWSTSWPRSWRPIGRRRLHCISSIFRNASDCWSSWSSARSPPPWWPGSTTRTGTRRPSLIAGTAFLVAVAAWWAYFDVSEAVSANALRRAEEAAEREEAEAGAQGDEVEKVDERHDLFIYGHLPVTQSRRATGHAEERGLGVRAAEVQPRIDRRVPDRDEHVRYHAGALHRHAGQCYLPFGNQYAVRCAVRVVPQRQVQRRRSSRRRCVAVFEPTDGWRPGWTGHRWLRVSGPNASASRLQWSRSRQRSPTPPPLSPPNKLKQLSRTRRLAAHLATQSTCEHRNGTRENPFKSVSSDGYATKRRWNTHANNVIGTWSQVFSNNQIAEFHLGYNGFAWSNNPVPKLVGVPEYVFQASQSARGITIRRRSGRTRSSPGTTSPGTRINTA